MVEEGVPGPSGAGSAEEVFPRESRSPRERLPDLGLWAKPPLQGPGSLRTLARCWGFGLLGGTESSCGPGTDSAPGAGDAKCVPVATPATSRGCFSLGALCVTPLDGSRHVASNPTCRSGLDPRFGSGSGSYGSAAPSLRWDPGHRLWTAQHRRKCGWPELRPQLCSFAFGLVT